MYPTRNKDTGRPRVQPGVKGSSVRFREGRAGEVEQAGRRKSIKARWHVRMVTVRKYRETQWKPERLQALVESVGVKACSMSANRRV